MLTALRWDSNLCPVPSFPNYWLIFCRTAFCICVVFWPCCICSLLFSVLSRHRSGISQSIRVGLTCCVSWCSREKNGAPRTSENHKAKAPRLLKKSANNLQSQTKSNQVSAHMILSIEKTELLEPKYNKYLNSGFYFIVVSHVQHGQQTGILALYLHMLFIEV